MPAVPIRSPFCSSVSPLPGRPSLNREPARSGRWLSSAPVSFRLKTSPCARQVAEQALARCDGTRRHTPTWCPRGRCSAREPVAQVLPSVRRSGDAEDACAFQCVGKDLQPTNFIVAAVAPDVHERQTRRSVALRHVGVPEHDDSIALLDELIGAQLELVIRADHLLQDLYPRLLSLMPPRAGKLGRVRALPHEVIAPHIERALEITLAEELITLPQRVRL